MTWVEFVDDQASSRITLDDGTVLTKCDQCRQMYSERNPPEEPPCDTCRVELKKENEEAAFIFRTVRSQIITFFNGQCDKVVDLNYPAVKMVMDLYNVRDQKACFEKVTRAFRYFNDKERHG